MNEDQITDPPADDSLRYDTPLDTDADSNDAPQEDETIANWRQSDGEDGITTDTIEGREGASVLPETEGGEPDPTPPSVPTLPAIALPEVYTPAQIEDMKARGMDDALIFYMAQGAIQAAQRMEGSMLQGAGLYQTTLQKAPDYEKLYGPRIRQHLSATVNQNVRHTQEGINQAMAVVLLEEANADGSSEGFLKALERHAQAANPTRRGSIAPSPKLPAQRPADRTPTPGVSGAAVRSAQGRPENLNTRAARLLGTSSRTAQDIFDEE